MLKKLILGMILSVVLILCAGIFLVAAFLNRGIKTGVETYGPKITGTAVAINQVDLSLRTGHGVLDGLEIGNPEGFKMPIAFSLGRIEIDVELFSFLSDKIVVNKIHITEPEIYFEKRGLVGSNLGVLLENIEESLSELAWKDEEATSDGPRFQISEFILEKGSITVDVAGQRVTVPMTDIRLSNLGTDEDGISVGELAQKIMVAMLGNVTKAVAIAAKSAIAEGADDAGAVIGSGMRAVGDAAGKGLKSIGGLFRKKKKD